MPTNHPEMNRPAPSATSGTGQKFASRKTTRISPYNGRLPAVQQWSDQVRLVTISPNGAPGHFDAVVDGELIVTSSRQPFLDAARVLLARGVDSNSWLIQRHAGSDVDSLRGKVGIAAKLTVQDGPDGRPRFRSYRSYPWAVAPPVARNEKSDHPAVASAERV
jgi:hypothetical protein